MQPTSRRCGGGAAPGPEPHGEARPPGAPRASDVLCARLRGFSRRRVFAPRRCSGSCCVRSSVLAVGTPGPPNGDGAVLARGHARQHFTQRRHAAVTTGVTEGRSGGT